MDFRTLEWHGCEILDFTKLAIRGGPKMKKNNPGLPLFCAILLLNLFLTTTAFSQTCIQWTPVADLPHPNFALGAAVHANKIYAVGGHYGYGGYLKEALVYDPPTDQWTRISDLNHERTYPGVVAYKDTVWAINGNCCGGPTIDSIEIYCPNENLWYYSNETQKPCYDPAVDFFGKPQDNMNRVVLSKENIYISGANNFNSEDLDQATAFRMWDGTDWKFLSPVPIQVGYPAVAAYDGNITTYDGKIFLIGGASNDPFAQTFIYDPILDEWSDGPALNIPRHTHTAVTLEDKIFVIGGITKINGVWTLTDSVEILDLSAPDPSWELSGCSKLSSPRYWHASVVLGKNIYTIGGGNASGNPLPVVEMGSLTSILIASVAGDPAGGSVSPPSQTVSYGGTATFTVTTNTGFIAAVSEGTLSGNTWTIPNVTSSHTVTVTFTNPPPVALCENVTVDAGPTCTANASIDNGSYDPNGDSITLIQSPAGLYPRGNTLVTLTVTDSKGASSQCTGTVTVEDREEPIISCPANMAVPTDPDKCTAVVNYPPMTATDNCPGVTVVTNPPSGSVFQKGTTTVTATATDASGNAATCSFAVTVEDKEPPKLVLPNPIVQPTDPGQCSAVVNFTVTATDNCPGVTVVSNPPSGSVFPKGVTTVSVTATDTSGNMATGTFTVTVVDKELPRITCPANIVIPADPGQCSAAVCFMVIATDNCPGVTVVSNPPSCSIFPKGITTVTSVATDASGNGATCTFTVTVEDKELPKIAAPPDLTRRIGVGSTMCGMVIGDSELGTPVFIDNCPGVTVTRTGIPPGNFFPVGTTTITYTSNDAAGNEASATQTVTVIDDGPPTIINVEANPNPSPVNTPVILTATLRDSTTGNCSVVSAEYSLDGGVTWHPMAAQDGTFDSPTEIVTGTAGPFPDAGVYEVCVHGTDVSGNTGGNACILLAVFDPVGGFVTGGGWITSPLGAYAPNPSLTGKATFGFVSKYQKGANVPTGQTEFQFKVASLNFHSESYDWLVVAEPKAKYKGTGTINGTGEYSFMLTAIDGQINGGHGVDKFRIKIWDKATNDIIYDNQTGASDTDDPTTALGGGSIVIHKE